MTGVDDYELRNGYTPKFEPKRNTALEVERKQLDRKLSAVRKDQSAAKVQLAMVKSRLNAMKLAHELTLAELGAALDTWAEEYKRVQAGFQKRKREVPPDPPRPVWIVGNRRGGEFTINDAVAMVRKEAPTEWAESAVDMVLTDIATSPTSKERYAAASKYLTEFTNRLTAVMRDALEYDH